MTEQERSARLAEMAGNASMHEEARWQRLANARRKDQAPDVWPSDAEADRHHKDRTDFMKNATRELYGGENAGSVEDQVGRRKYYSEHRSDHAAFRR